MEVRKDGIGEEWDLGAELQKKTLRIGRNGCGMRLEIKKYDLKWVMGGETDVQPDGFGRPNPTNLLILGSFWKFTKNQ